jgi:tetratricopeptide (TPR) repeat protein
MADGTVDTPVDTDDLPQTSAAALALALDGATRDPRLSKAIEGFLVRQEALLAKQAHHLDEQLKKIALSLIDQRLTVALKVLTVIVGVAVAVGFGWMVYDAASDHALVIEAFSVPPDLAARGLTGQAVAAQLLDKLQAMQDATDSARPADSYVNNWDNDIKVEIPDTGLSIGEFHRLLVAWLGHETHITGEVWHSGDGLAITARAGGEGATVTGKESEFGVLLQQAAERIYERTQPYRYASYLANDGDFPAGDGTQRLARARAILQRLADGRGNLRERAWAMIGMGSALLFSGDIPASLAEYRKAAGMFPGFVMAWSNVQWDESDLEHQEAGLAAAHETERLIGRGDADMAPQAAASQLAVMRAQIAFATGDFAGAETKGAVAANLPDYGGNRELGLEIAAFSLAHLHEDHAATRAWQALPLPDSGSTAYPPAGFEPQLDGALSDWHAVLAGRPSAEAALHGTYNREQIPQIVWPYVAEALAHTGDIAGAEALIAKTPMDCDACVLARGDIAALKHDWRAADHWFALVSTRTPSIPFADTQWGTALLHKGDFSGAIAHFAEAHARGPHFADPLELWGEALIAQNRSDLALAKFAEAAQYAPNWGRLHLKWGEALAWSGDKAGAARQFAIAARLDLSPRERVQLEALRHG